LLRVRSAWPLVLTVVLAVVGVAAASDVRSAVPRAAVPRLAWVDREVPAGAHALVLWSGGCHALARTALFTEFFNSRVDRVGHVPSSARSSLRPQTTASAPAATQARAIPGAVSPVPTITARRICATR